MSTETPFDVKVLRACPAGPPAGIYFSRVRIKTLLISCLFAVLDTTAKRYW